MLRALLALALTAGMANCAPVDASRPGCRDGSTYRADILPMLNGRCPTRADEGRAANYEIRTWDIGCAAACAQRREFTMLLNSPHWPTTPVTAPAPPRHLPEPMARAR